MEDCRVNMRMVPLRKIVAASIIDMYGDINRTEHKYSHWAARGLKKLYRESLRMPPRRVLIPVNRNTNTATLPVDFDYETFVGYISNGVRIPAINNPDLLNECTIENANVNLCGICKQDKGICEDLNISETTDIIEINENSYFETTTKTLYPNGAYYLEKNTPFLNIETDEVEYRLTKEFISNIDLLPCGCPNQTPENEQIIAEVNPSVYGCYYTPCGCAENYGLSYKMFEESGLIQIAGFIPDQLYLEYNSFVPKMNGQFMVPEVAYETLVEWTKFKAIQHKPNITTYEKEWQKQNYIRERRNMERFKFSLDTIIRIASSLPIFAFSSNTGARQVARAMYSVPATPRNIAKCETAPNMGGGNTIINNNNITIVNKADYTIAVKVGEVDGPIAGEAFYQNDLLKGATGITYILVAKQIETIKDGDFAFDSVTGTIDRTPNVWVTGDTLIINYNKD